MKTSILSVLLYISLVVTSCQQEKAVDTSVNTSVDTSSEMHAIENGLLPAIQLAGEAPRRYTLPERMKHYKVPGVSMAVVKDGTLRWAKGYGVANTRNETKVDENTLFQAGSISKPLAALSALKLVEEGLADLDEDVNTYLKGWKIPDTPLTREEKVTLRRLLTHTAGMTVHGFPGYQQTDTFPAIESVLKGEGNTAAIYVDTIPGSLWRYSGGGYTVMEKAVEDLSGLPFEAYMHTHILQPLGMKSSTYEQPLPPDRHALASAAYNGEGEIIEGLWHNYPEQAAAGLWTTPADLARYCVAVSDMLSGTSAGLLSKETAAMMLTKHRNDWGLGPSLQWEGDSLIFQHGGKNAGFTNSLIAFAHRGDAVIIMTNADNGGSLIEEILRSVSDYYGWGIRSSRRIEPMDMMPERLSGFVGEYRYIEPVPGIGEYVVEVALEEGRLVVIDPNEDETLALVPVEAVKFIDVEQGNEILFQEDEHGRSLSFLWNNRLRFEKRTNHQ